MLVQIPVSRLKVEWDQPNGLGGFGAVYFAQTTDGDEVLLILAIRSSPHSNRLLVQVVVKLSYNDSFSERLLENEMQFNDKLSSLIPEHHGRCASVD